MFVPSNAIPYGPSSTSRTPPKVSRGPHVGGLGQEALRQSPTPRGARQSWPAGGGALQGPIAQSLSCMQLEAQAVPVALQFSYGEQFTTAVAVQVPLPLHVRSGVAEPLEHIAAAHGVPAGYFWQWPLPSQLPSSPHVEAAWLVHWPMGAAVPAVMGKQVPVATLVSAIVHAWQVPVQAVLQQMPPTQKPLEHCRSSPPVHVAPLACAAVHTPLLQKLPLAHSPSFAQAAHVRPSQNPLWQSVSTRQSLVLAHGRHMGPPQSTSVLPSSVERPSLQLGGTHMLEMQTLGEAQSAVTLHWTQEPPPFEPPSLAPASALSPSQTVPPWSLHVVPSGAFVVPQTSAVHVETMQSDAGVGQSLGIMHATHLPLPSQTAPPLSVHLVSAAAFMVPHAPMAHVAVTHVVLVLGHSAAELQDAPPVPVVPLLLVVLPVLVVLPLLLVVAAPPVPPIG